MTSAYDIYPAVLSVLDMISAGRTLTSACDEAHIGVPTFKKYVEQTRELQEAFEEAEQRGYDAMTDVLLEINNTKHHYGCSDPKEMKIISDNIKWLASKRNSKQYGERVAVDVNVSADRAIVDALSRARHRIPSSVVETAPMIDITPTPVMDAGVVDEEAAILAEILA